MRELASTDTQITRWSCVTGGVLYAQMRTRRAGKLFYSY